MYRVYIANGLTNSIEIVCVAFVAHWKHMKHTHNIQRVYISLSSIDALSVGVYTIQ